MKRSVKFLINAILLNKNIMIDGYAKKATTVQKLNPQISEVYSQNLELICTELYLG